VEISGKTLSRETGVEHRRSTSGSVYEAWGRRADVWSYVHDVQRGHVAAFEHVYRTYVGEVRAYLYTLTREAGLAQDLTSETFLRALKAIRSVENRGRPFRGWLMTIARNVVRDHRKSWSIRNVIPVEQDALLHACGTETTTEDVVVRRDIARRLRRCIEALPPDQRECLEWRYVADLSVGDTARLMSRSNDAVRAIHYRAVRKLGRLMLEEGTGSCRAA